MKTVVIALAAMLLLACFFLQPVDGRCRSFQAGQACAAPEYASTAGITAIPAPPKAGWPWTPVPVPSPKPVPVVIPAVQPVAPVAQPAACPCQAARPLAAMLTAGPRITLRVVAGIRDRKPVRHLLARVFLRRR